MATRAAMPIHPLKKYRAEHQLSQPALAVLLGVTKATICRWENGQRAPRRRDIPKIVEKTGIDASALMGLEAKT